MAGAEAQASGQKTGRGIDGDFFIFFSYISHIILLTPQQQSAEPRNSASAETLAVARRPKEASREKTRPPPVSRGVSPCKVLEKRKTSERHSSSPSEKKNVKIKEKKQFCH